MKNLWLDDVRDCPYIGWLVAKTAEEAIEILKNNDIEIASLDHDLADSHYMHCFRGEPYKEDYEEKTGYNVVLWMEENNIYPSKMCYVHSMNPTGAEKMSKVLSRHYGTYGWQYHYKPYSKAGFYV